MRRVVLLGLIVAVAVGAWLVDRGDRSDPAEQGSVGSAPLGPTWTVAPLSPPPEVPTAIPTPPTSSSTQGPQGRALARAWLTAYLSRPSRGDEAWTEAIAPLSTPELVKDLRSAGPELVGLDQLSSWQVTGVEPYESINPSVDTESRQLLAYAATVTDGTHTEQKPFELYAYRQDDGRWLVGMIDQPYSSEG